MHSQLWWPPNSKLFAVYALAGALSLLFIGTLGYGIGNQLTPDSLTTPDVVTLQSRMHHFHQQGCEFVVMEVSSHALDQ